MKRTLSLIISLLMLFAMIGSLSGCKDNKKESVSSQYTEQEEYACPNCGFVGVIEKWQKSGDDQYICPQCKTKVTMKVQQNSNDNSDILANSAVNSNDSGSGYSQSSNSNSSKQVSSSKVDLNGYIIKIASCWSGNWKPLDGVSVAGDKMLDAFAKLEEEYKCKINFVFAPPESLVRDVTASIQAGKKYADVIHIPPQQFTSLIKSDIFEPLSNITQININDTIFNNTSAGISTFKGVRYGLSWSSHVNFISPLVMFFNKDLLQRTGQPDLYQIVESKQWTWDKFTKICSDIQQKDSTVKGMGAIDSLSAMASWPKSNGIAYAEEINGKFIFPSTDKRLITSLQFAQDIQQKYKIVFENKPDDWSQWQQTVLPAFMDGKLAFMIQDYYVGKTFLYGKMKNKYGIVPFPMGPDVKNYFGQFGNVDFFVFPKGNKDLDKASKLLYLIAQKTYNNNFTNEIGTSVYDQGSIDMLKIMINNPVVDPATNIADYNSFLFPELAKITKGQITPKNLLDSIQPKAQSILDQFFRQK